MAWFNKKKQEEELPPLPQLDSQKNTFPSIKDLPEISPKQEYKPLSPLKPVYTQNTSPIKEIINSHNENDILNESLNDKRKELSPQIQKKEFSISDFPNSKKPKEPIYIRLDKFETTFSSFKEIKEKIKEVEEYLLKLKEIKEKEEKELEEWEQEIQLIKTRIDTIDKTIFDKIE